LTTPAKDDTLLMDDRYEAEDSAEAPSVKRTALFFCARHVLACKEESGHRRRRQSIESRKR